MSETQEQLEDDEVEPIDDVDDAIDLLEQALETSTTFEVARELIGEALDFLRNASEALSEDFLLTSIKCDDGKEPGKEHTALLDAFEPDDENPDASLAELNAKLRLCKRPAVARYVESEDEDEEDTTEELRDEQ